MNRFVFELRVLGVMLREIFWYPLSTSRLRVDTKNRKVWVER